jgi:hypothetical protein
VHRHGLVLAVVYRCRADGVRVFVDAGAPSNDEANKNRLCRPVPFPRTTADYARTMAVNMSNPFQ